MPGKFEVKARVNQGSKTCPRLRLHLGPWKLVMNKTATLKHLRNYDGISHNIV